MKVAVIGAGIAGLTAAKELKKLAVHVDVFEKSRGLGGRLACRRLEWGQLNLGAQYYTARDPSFRRIVDEWIHCGAANEWEFTPHAIRDGAVVSSPDTTTRYVGTPRMNVIAHKLAEGLSIHLQTRIQSVTRENNRWMLYSESGQTFGDYDWVLLSLPAQQSKDLLKGFAIADEIPELALSPCWSLGIATKGNVDDNLQGVFGDNTVSWMSRLSALPENSFDSEEFDDVWMLHFSGDWSDIHGKPCDVDLLKTGWEWFSHTVRDFAGNSLVCVNSYQHFWRYAKTTSSAGNNSCIVDKSLQLGLIGDWCNGGRVEGAYLSAVACCNEIDHHIR